MDNQRPLALLAHDEIPQYAGFTKWNAGIAKAPDHKLCTVDCANLNFNPSLTTAMSRPEDLGE